MNKRIIYLIIAVIAVIAIVIIKIYVPNSTSHTITLPSPAGENAGNTVNDNINRVEVNRETVQSVLKTLTRSDSFSRTYKVKTYWEGGESESTLGLWQKGDNIRMTYTDTSSVKNILISGNDLYIWYDGYSGVSHSKLAEGEVNKEIDRFSRLVTYEDILDIPPENIIKANYAEQSGQPCIYAEYESGDLGYVNHIYVSIDSGLLVSSSRYDGERLTNSMEPLSSPELSTPPDDMFTIPVTGKA